MDLSVEAITFDQRTEAILLEKFDYRGALQCSDAYLLLLERKNNTCGPKTDFLLF